MITIRAFLTWLTDWLRERKKLLYLFASTAASKQGKVIHGTRGFYNESRFIDCLLFSFTRIRWWNVKSSRLCLRHHFFHSFLSTKREKERSTLALALGLGLTLFLFAIRMDSIHKRNTCLFNKTSCSSSFKLLSNRKRHMVSKLNCRWENGIKGKRLPIKLKETLTWTAKFRSYMYMKG